MATITNNDLVKGFRGKFGNDLVFRTMRGKTFASPPASKNINKKESEAQRSTRVNFQNATQWAQITLLDPEKKAYYKQRAKALKLPNAYTAAITDYMRKAKVVKKQFGNTLHYKIHKNGFALTQVTATVRDTNGVEKKIDVHQRNGNWIMQYRPDGDTATTITFAITDISRRSNVITTYG